MTSGICERITSWCQFDTQKVQKYAAAGLTGIALYLGGVPMAIVTAGACYYGYSKLNANLIEPSRVSYQRADLPDDFKEDFKANESVALDPSVFLDPVKERPARIEWQKNSCFCSSLMWSFILNEPAVLEEIPQAIGRILHQQGYGIDEDGPVTLEGFYNLYQWLQQQENSEEELNDSSKKLLSLLQLYFLVKDFQKADRQGSMSGERVNELREIAARVGPFVDVANIEHSPLGDPDDLYQILSDLIFENSSHQQILTTTMIKPNETNEHRERTIGGFSLPVHAGERISETFFQFLNHEDNLEIGGIQQPVVKRGQFQKAPLFLTFTLNRLKEPEAPQEEVALPAHLQHAPDEELVRYFEDNKESFQEPAGPNINMQPVTVDEEFALPSQYLENGDNPAYELVGIAKHLGPDNRHYIAYVKRGKTWYVCDDNKASKDFWLFSVNQKVQKISQNMLFTPEEANTGYMFFYRLKERLYPE